MAENAFAGTVQQLKREIASLESQLSRARNALRLLSGTEDTEIARTPAPASTGFAKTLEVLTALNATLERVNVTEALIRVVKQTPGLTKAEVLRQVVPHMATVSASPRKTASARLGQLLKTKGRLVMREGKVYPVG